MAAKAKLYDQKGKELKELKLNSDIFEVERNDDLIALALRRQHANARLATAHTKVRGEIRGGGRKPYRQKGTGRARQGSIRNVHYRGGAVMFGPRSDRNYTLDLPRKQRRKALFSALSERARENNILVLDKYVDKDMKTKNFVALIEKLPTQRSVLIVTDRESKDLINRVCSNAENVHAVFAPYVNIDDILKHNTVIFLEAALAELESTFLTTNK